MQTQPSKDTRQSILDAAEALILTRGYNGFSHKDIAEVVGIRKASIHRHFPSKEDLGAAFVEGYCHRFELWRKQVAAMDQWLTQVLRQGQAQGLLRSEPEAQVMARVMMNAMSCSMKTARVLQDADRLVQVFHALMSTIPPLSLQKPEGSRAKAAKAQPQSTG